MPMVMSVQSWSKKFDQKDGKMVIKVAIPGTDGDASTSAQDISVVLEIMIKG